MYCNATVHRIRSLSTQPHIDLINSDSNENRNIIRISFELVLVLEKFG